MQYSARLHKNLFSVTMMMTSRCSPYSFIFFNYCRKQIRWASVSFTIIKTITHSDDLIGG